MGRSHVKFSVNRCRSHAPRHALVPLPDKMRFHKCLLWLLWALDLQRVLQQLGYDIPGRPLLF